MRKLLNFLLDNLSGKPEFVNLPLFAVEVIFLVALFATGTTLVSVLLISLIKH